MLILKAFLGMQGFKPHTPGLPSSTRSNGFISLQSSFTPSGNNTYRPYHHLSSFVYQYWLPIDSPSTLVLQQFSNAVLTSVLSLVLCWAQLLSHVELFATRWTVAHQTLSMDFPGKNTGLDCHFLLQGIFLIQGLKLCLLSVLHWQVDSLPLHFLGSPFIFLTLS